MQPGFPHRCEKRISFAMPLYTEHDHFTETGSGQTWGKHSQKRDDAFVAGSFGISLPLALHFGKLDEVCASIDGIVDIIPRCSAEPNQVQRKNGLFFEFFLCLSRACLGNKIVFIYKWRKKWSICGTGNFFFSSNKTRRFAKTGLVPRQVLGKTRKEMLQRPHSNWRSFTKCGHARPRGRIFWARASKAPR
jgi:hypothetical protein